jgi:hypothetical protein
VKTVVALVLLLALVVLVLTAVVMLVQRRREARAPWRMVEDAAGETIEVYAVRHGHERLLIGSVPFADEDFDSRLYELRAAGRQKLLALNERADA